MGFEERIYKAGRFVRKVYIGKNTPPPSENKTPSTNKDIDKYAREQVRKAISKERGRNPKKSKYSLPFHGSFLGGSVVRSPRIGRGRIVKKVIYRKVADESYDPIW